MRYKPFEAKLRWLSPEEGGRQCPMPLDTWYAPLIFFEGADVSCAWSVRFKTTSEDKDGRMTVIMRFTCDDVPLCIKRGDCFTLHESAHPVAAGIITGAVEEQGQGESASAR